MPSKKPQLKAIVEIDDYEKFKMIADNENRTISNLLQTLIKEKIKHYESENGQINIGKTINMGDNNGTINM